MLYGTKQAGREWSNKLKSTIKACGLEESPEDPCLHFKKNRQGDLTLVVCTVVDDLLGAGVPGAWEEFTAKLEENGIALDAKSVGEAAEFNGMQIIRRGVHHYELAQDQYFNELERSYSTEYSWRPPAKVPDTPLGPTLDKGLISLNNESMGETHEANERTTKEARADRELDMNKEKAKTFATRFSSLLGSLIWPATMTRPDLAFGTSAAAQHAKEPRTRHMKALERMLHYGIATKDKHLVYDFSHCPRQMNLTIMSDSDFASDEETRKSRSGVWVAINSSPVFWASRKQTVIADSTAAAETLAGHLALRHARQIAGNLRAMGFTVDYAPLFSDNAAMLKRITGGRSSEGFGAKHLSISNKTLQEAANTEHRDIWPFYIPTDLNVADIFTKGHLAGKDADKKFTHLEAKARGDTPDKGWIREAMRAKRPAQDSNKHKPILAMEREQPIIDLKAYDQLASWGRVYAHHFNPKSRANTKPMDETHHPVITFASAMNVSLNENGKIHLPRPTTIVEVFSGPNKSASRAIIDLCANPDMLTVITVDREEKYQPDLCLDVLRWNPTTALGGRVDFMWLSPPCPAYSKANTRGRRDLKGADATAKAAFRLIEQIQPTAWVVENPTGMMRNRPWFRLYLKFLKPTTYCSYDGFKYRKETDIVTNIPCHLPHCRLTPCPYKAKHGKHMETAQQGASLNGTPGNRLAKLHRVPHGLVQRLFAFFCCLSDNMTTSVNHYEQDTLDASTVEQGV